MPYEKRPVNQYDNDKSVEENIKNDAVVTPEIVNHLDSGIDLIQKETLKKMKEKIGGEIKAEPQDLSATTLGLITGNGGPINIESIPQDYSVTPKKTTFLDEIEETIADISVMPPFLGKLGDYYDPGTGKLFNTAATVTFKPTGKLPTTEFTSFITKGVSSWIFFKSDNTFINGKEMKSTEIPVETIVAVPNGAAYMIGNVKDGYFYANDPDKSQYWIEAASAKAAKMTYRYSIDGLLVEEENLSEPIKDYIESAGNGLAKEYKGEVIVNFGDSVIENKNPSVSEILSEFTGATTINVGFGGCMMSPHPNAAFANFSMSNLVDAVVANDFSKQEAALTASGIPASFRAQLNALKAINWSTVKTITISYGTNDWLNSNPLDNASDKFDKASYLGALRYSIRKIQQAYRHLQVVVSPPIFRSTNDRTENSNNWKNGNGLYMKDFANGVATVGVEMKIVVADTFFGLGINEFNEGYYFPANDGTHPNAFGRRLLAAKLAEAIVYGTDSSSNLSLLEKKADTTFATQETRIKEIEVKTKVQAENLFPNKSFDVTGYGVSTGIRINLKKNHKYYARRTFEVVNGTANTITGRIAVLTTHNLITQGSTVSQVSTYTGEDMYNLVYAYGPNVPDNTGNSLARFNNLVIINLTETFGAGNEPLIEQMDMILSQFTSSWFDGVKNLFVAKEVLNRTLKAERELNMNAKNLIENGDLSKGLTANFKAGPPTSLLSVKSNRLKIIDNVVSPDAYLFVQTPVYVLGNSYYVGYDFKPYRTHVPKMFSSHMTSARKTAIKGIFNRVSMIYKPTASNARIALYTNEASSTETTTTTSTEYSNLIVVNLTETFGAGNEPTEDQMDRLLAQYPNSWFDGTQNLFNAHAALAEMRSLDSLKANVKQETWLIPPLLNGGITNETTPVLFRKNSMGRVEMTGRFKPATAGSLVMTFPVGYRSGRSERKLVPTNLTNQFAVILIGTTGSFYVEFPTTNIEWIDVSGVSFSTD